MRIGSVRGLEVRTAYLLLHRRVWLRPPLIPFARVGSWCECGVGGRRAAVSATGGAVCDAAELDPAAAAVRECAVLNNHTLAPALGSESIHLLYDHKQFSNCKPADVFEAFTLLYATHAGA